MVNLIEYPASPFPMGHLIGVGDYVIDSDVMDGGKVLGYSDSLDKFRAFDPQEVSA